MQITRIGTTPRWSDVVVYNSTVYFVEVPSNLDGGIKEQSHNLLSIVEATLKRVGSSKANIIMATIYLQDISQINEFNQIWDSWLVKGTAPVRVCIEAKLANPDYKVELQVVAGLIEQNT